MNLDERRVSTTHFAELISVPKEVIVSQSISGPPLMSSTCKSPADLFSIELSTQSTPFCQAMVVEASRLVNTVVMVVVEKRMLRAEKQGGTTNRCCC